MTKRGIVIIIGYILLVAVATVVGQIIGGVLVVVVTAMMMGVGGLVSDPFKQRLADWVSATMFKQTGYRIYVFGRPGSGKTTLIRSILTSGAVLAPRSTDTFDYYKANINLEMSGKIAPIELHIGDYKGQKPSQMIVDVPLEFVGEEGHRAIDAIFFVVDIAPRKFDEATGEQYSDDQMLEWLLEGDPVTKIHDRVQEHRDYIGESTLEVILRIVYSENLRSVRLLINKLDLLEKVIARGAIPGVAPDATQQYGLDLFSDLVRHIQSACRANEIDDVACQVVSAKEGAGLRAVLSDVLDRRSAARALKGR